MLKKITLLIFSILFLKNIQSATPQIELECPGLKSFKKWCGGEYKGNKEKSCIMISTPITERGDPPYKSRGEVYATIYHIPSEDSEGVFYITTGYTYKKETIVTVKVDKNNKHELNVLENDSAFSDDESIDKEIINEMKKGNRLKVVGFSSRGTKTTDTYSLAGFTAAYTHISNLCNVK
tara:strand:+ start:644 stop:1180 length:537 start_codon:yes stop_codon:yes gene_type:complete